MTRGYIQFLCSGEEGEIRAEGRVFGVTCWPSGERAGRRVFEASMRDYDRIHHWWVAGYRLVRTLGPHERIEP